MGATNDTQRFTLPDNLTHDYLIPYAFSNGAIAVGIGDLCYFKGQITSPNGDVAYPADQFTSLGQEFLDQQAFANVFVGVSEQQVLSTETNQNKRFVVRVDGGTYDFKCPSQTWKHGDPVAIFSNGVNLDPQQLDKPAVSAGIIGFVVKDYPVATTRVRVVLYPAMGGNVPASGTRIYSLGALAADNISNVNAKTAFVSTATIPGGTLNAGDVIHCKIMGQCTSQAASNTTTINLEILTAANTFTTVLTTGAVNGTNTGVFIIEGDLFFTAVGNAGSFYAVGDTAFGANTSGTRAVQILAATNINTSALVTVRVTATQSAQGTTNNCSLLDFDVSNHRR